MFHGVYRRLGRDETYLVPFDCNNAQATAWKSMRSNSVYLKSVLDRPSREVVVLLHLKGQDRNQTALLSIDVLQCELLSVQMCN